jgi:ribosomal protein S18 acetylase RimI-like enzyme
VAARAASGADAGALADHLPGGGPAVRVTRRSAGTPDESYLRQLFREGRDDLALLPEPVREPLLDVQYRGWTRQLAADYPAAARDILVADGADAGALILDHGPERIHLVDITVARAMRRRGIASAALRSVIDEAGERAVTLTVWSGNAVARGLYRRFGFAEINGSNVTEGYIFMERRSER